MVKKNLDKDPTKGRDVTNTTPSPLPEKVKDAHKKAQDDLNDPANVIDTESPVPPTKEGTEGIKGA